MANIVNFSTYGFLDDILALNEDNWRNFFKPIVYDEDCPELTDSEIINEMIKIYNRKSENSNKIAN